METAPEPITSPYGTLTLQRWPRRRRELLRAWDTADLYLLEQVATLEMAPALGRLLILNDAFGALALSLARFQPWSGGDSWLAYQGLLANAREAASSGPESSFRWEDRWRWPDAPIPPVDLVLIKVPKHLALLEYQLAALSRQLPPGVPVWLAGMDKHLPVNLKDVLAHWLDRVQMGRGWKKARLFSGLTRDVTDQTLPFPTRVKVPGEGWALQVEAGVFSREQLDIGARFFMQHVPAGDYQRITDMGCGNGVIGMVAAQRNPGAHITFTDESYQAIRSARANMARYLPDANAEFFHTHGMQGVQAPQDLILLNPPFHLGHAVDDGMARMLFRQARKALAPGGELRVIGNRHLDYHRVLKRGFGQVAVIGSNKKFVVISARA